MRPSRDLSDRIVEDIHEAMQTDIDDGRLDIVEDILHWFEDPAMSEMISEIIESWMQGRSY